DERAKIEIWIRAHYDDFVTRVAEGRKMTKEDVDKVGQGRFYAGVDGRKAGLVDDIGGMMMALDFARKDAGIADDEEIEILEIPRSRGLMSLLPLQTTVDKLADDPVIQYIKTMAKNPYEPVPVLAPGSYPMFEN
ncbi:MAG: hypothetical protein EHM72_03670, partial [Calditrichaeota bacterium]